MESNQIFQITQKNKSKLDEFWNFCKRLHEPAMARPPEKELETFLQEFEVKTQDTERAVQLHKQFLETVPLMVPLRNWLEKQLSQSLRGEEVLNCFRKLIEKKSFLRMMQEVVFGI